MRRRVVERQMPGRLGMQVGRADRSVQIDEEPRRGVEVQRNVEMLRHLTRQQQGAGIPATMGGQQMFIPGKERAVSLGYVVAGVLAGDDELIHAAGNPKFRRGVSSGAAQADSWRAHASARNGREACPAPTRCRAPRCRHGQRWRGNLRVATSPRHARFRASRSDRSIREVMRAIGMIAQRPRTSSRQTTCIPG